MLVAGSVVAGEEEAVLAAYDLVQRQWRRTLLILAPRKPAQFDAAAAITAEGGWKVVRRSDLDLTATLDEAADVLLLDSIGELAGLYSLADATFVGGSLVPVGRPQYSRAGLVRSSAGLRRLHGKFPRDGRHNFSMRTPESKSPPAKVSAKSGFSSSRTMRCANAWAQPRAKSLERNRGATERSLDRIAAVWNRSAKGHSA